VRWFHAAVYVTVLVLLGTGWWLTLGQEGQPSPLSRVVGRPDTQLHNWTGWATAGIVLVGLVLGVRSAITFTVESVRFDRGDVRWLISWPKGVLTGRFRDHEGHFDPGQRIANVVMVVLLAVLVVSGLWMARLHGGPTFAVLVRVHRWTTYAVTPVILGHILIAMGILPGYRGVWRSMHLGGRLPVDVARRLWPGWLNRVESASTKRYVQGGSRPRSTDSLR
jgi:cytochrome b subunit of formate dehydrogenase